MFALASDKVPVEACGLVWYERGLSPFRLCAGKPIFTAKKGWCEACRRGIEAFAPAGGGCTGPETALFVGWPMRRGYTYPKGPLSRSATSIAAGSSSESNTASGATHLYVMLRPLGILGAALPLRRERLSRDAKTALAAFPPDPQIDGQQGARRFQRGGR
jgi:hypothetical protein